MFAETAIRGVSSVKKLRVVLCILNLLLLLLLIFNLAVACRRHNLENELLRSHFTFGHIMQTKMFNKYMALRPDFSWTMKDTSTITFQSESNSVNEPSHNPYIRSYEAYSNSYYDFVNKLISSQGKLVTENEMPETPSKNSAIPSNKSLASTNNLIGGIYVIIALSCISFVVWGAVFSRRYLICWYINYLTFTARIVATCISTLRNRIQQENCKYDACIIYCDQDKSWVEKALKEIKDDKLISATEPQVLKQSVCMQCKN